MKSSTFILVGSFALNVGLVAAIVRDYRTPASSAVAAPVAVAGKGPVGTLAQGSSSVGSPTDPSKSSPETLWPQLMDGDFDHLAQRLRMAGFPPRAVHDVLIALFQKRSWEKRQELLGRIEDTPYWRQPPRFSEDPKLRSKRDALIKEDLEFRQKYDRGADLLADDEDRLNAARRRYGDLPLEKLQRVAELENEYQDRMMKAMYPFRDGTETTAAEGKQMMALRREQDEKIAALLTPDEYEQYELRNGPPAGWLRSSLETFRPSEAEYKAIFDFYRSLDKQFPDPSDESQRMARAAMAKQSASQLEAALGADRYAEYQQAQESANDKLSRLVARLDLPLTVIGQVNAVRDDVIQRAKDIRANPQLSSAERDTQLSALQQEATTKVTAALGERVFGAYKDMKGDWIRALSSGSGSRNP